MRICPNCQYGNREGILFCEDCGQPMAGVPATATRQLNPKDLPQQVKNDLWGSAHFGTQASVILHVRDVPEPIVVQPNPRVVLGRIDLTTQSTPDLDLSPFGAQEKGVSRVHAAFERADELLMLTDLSSVNGTHLNGQRLSPNQPRVLRDGDEVRLGKLILNVYFM